MTQTARTAEDFAALPEDTVIIAIERLFVDRPDRVKRTLWKRFGRWVNLDPGDKGDGEDAQEDRYLASFLTGFGNRRRPPGIALVLGPGEPISFDDAANLPPRSFIRVSGTNDEYFEHNGDGRFTHMDPGDVYDGAYAVPTDGLAMYGAECFVLYRPHDEAGLFPDPEPTTDEPALPPAPAPQPPAPADPDLLRGVAHALHADDVAHGRAHHDFERMNEGAIGWYFDNAAAVIRALPALGLQRSTTG